MAAAVLSVTFLASGDTSPRRSPSVFVGVGHPVQTLPDMGGRDNDSIKVLGKKAQPLGDDSIGNM
jgi:hypothetical protein